MMATRVVSFFFSFLLLGLLGCFSANGTSTHTRAILDDENANSLDDDQVYAMPQLLEEVETYQYDLSPVRFELYTKQNPTEPELIKFEQPTLKNFNISRPTKVGIHGWMTDGVGVKGLRDAFVGNMDVNFILVNWTQVDTLIYPAARWKVDALGKWVALMLDFLRMTQNLDMATVHIVGHSLGAHIAGVAGFNVKEGKLSRISGLDPAGVLFDDKIEGRLSADDAIFVDVIHTCSNVLGYKNPLGHLDFYPNRGTCVQPGCAVLDLTTGTCSHNRAYDFYQESVTGESKFKAWPCEGAGTDANMTLSAVLMGYPAQPPTDGAPTVFCLKTGRTKPFALPDDDQQHSSWLPHFPDVFVRDSNSLKRTVESVGDTMKVFVWLKYMTRGLFGAGDR